MYKNYLNHFVDNKYSKWYYSIIDRAISENRKKIKWEYELHHILPKAKSLYPEFSSLKHYSWNGVLLTLKEHFICHLLLIKCFKGKQKYSMAAALRRMSFGSNTFASRKYELFRGEFQKLNRGKTHPSYGTKLSLETRTKMSNSATGKKKTAIHRKKIGDANSRRAWRDDSREKLSSSHKGKKLTPEHREKIRQLNIGENNAMYGRKWVYHDQREQSFAVKPDQLENYINSGWTLGQKWYEDRGGKKRGLSRDPIRVYFDKELDYKRTKIKREERPRS